MWRWLRIFHSEVGPPALRAVVAPIGDPYREALGAPLLERTAEPCTLDQLVAALRAAALAVRPRRRGADVRGSGPARVMPIRVRDPGRIVPTEIACGTSAPELLIDLGLAVVPLFGPVTVEVPFAGTLLVDGSRDRAVLGEEAAERVRQTGRRIAKRAPISFPVLLELARRMRQS